MFLHSLTVHQSSKYLEKETCLFHRTAYWLTVKILFILSPNLLSYTSYIQVYLYLLCLVLLHFTNKTAIFTDWKCVANPYWASLSVSFFPTAFAHYVTLCSVSVMFPIFQAFSLLLLCLLWWSVISDIWCTIAKRSWLPKGSDNG